MKAKTKLIIIFSTVAAAISALGLYAYLQIYLMNHLRSDGLHGLLISKEEKYFYQKLKELKPFNPSGKEMMSLKELTNFEWDEVSSSSCYSPNEEPTYIDFYKNGKLVQTIHSYGFYYYNFAEEGEWIYFVGYAKLNGNNSINIKINKKINANSSEYKEIFYEVTFINN